MTLSEGVCFQLSRYLVRRRHTGDAGARQQTRDSRAYADWRKTELQQQFCQHFDLAEIRGKDVVDFGCGDGGLAILLASEGVKSITGIDLSERFINIARERASNLPAATQPVFVLGQDPTRIDLPDASVDVLLCFDVLEHILAYRQIIAEWARVLRPGGKVLIWWMPWLHPYGHHIAGKVPIPWAHAIFSEKTLMRAAAKILALPEYQPSFWDLDEKGNRKTAEWEHAEQLEGLNRLTIRRFEPLCQQVGLAIEKRKLNGFKGGRLAQISHGLTRLPGLREYFTASAVYTLVKPYRT